MKTKGLRSSAGPYHDTLKFMVARIGVGLGYQTVEMESPGEGKFIPDVAMRHYKGKIKRKPRVYVEVQDKLSHDWMDKIEANYNKDELIIIDIADFNPRYYKAVKDESLLSCMFYVQGVYGMLMARIANETNIHVYRKVNEARYIDYRGHHIKDQYTSRKRIDWIEDKKKGKL